MDRPAPARIAGFKITNVQEMAREDDCLAGTIARYLDVDIPQSVARGRQLFCSASFATLETPLGEAHLGVDILRLGPGDAFPLHTHPGHHCLLVVRGRGTVTVNGTVYPTRPGDLYLVDGEVPHAVGAGPMDAHYLLSFGAPHKHVDDPGRMTVIKELSCPVCAMPVLSTLTVESDGEGVARIVHDGRRCQGAPKLGPVEIR